MKTVPVTRKAPAELRRYIERLNARAGGGWRLKGPIYRTTTSSGRGGFLGGWDRALLVNDHTDPRETRRMVRVGRWQKS